MSNSQSQLHIFGFGLITKLISYIIHGNHCFDLIYVILKHDGREETACNISLSCNQPLVEAWLHVKKKIRIINS